MKRIRDILSGVVIGIGFFGLYICASGGNMDLQDFLFHMAIIFSGILIVMVDW